MNISQAVVPEKIYSFLLSIVDSYHGNNLTLLSVSALVVLWSASKGVLALIRGLNHIYEVGETRGYLLLRLKASFYTIFLLLAILLSAGVLVFGNTLAGWLIPDNGIAARLWRIFGGIRHVFGGVEDESYIKPRLKAGKIVIRASERLYREGQWKSISPRGRKKKYEDHTQYLTYFHYTFPTFNLTRKKSENKSKFFFLVTLTRNSFQYLQRFEMFSHIFPEIIRNYFP